MINETCNLFVKNSFDCVKVELTQSIISNFHFYIGIFIALAIFLATMFGSRISPNKQERTFYGLIIVLSMIPVISYSQIQNYVMMVIGFIFFLGLNYHFSNYKNLASAVKSNNKSANNFREYFSSFDFKWQILVIFFIWSVFNLLLGAFSKIGKEHLIYNINYFVYFIIGVMLLIDMFLSFNLRKNFWKGYIILRDEKKDKIYFDGINYLEKSNMVQIISKNNKFMNVNKDDILSIEYQNSHSNYTLKKFSLLVVVIVILLMILYILPKVITNLLIKLFG